MPPRMTVACGERDGNWIVELHCGQDMMRFETPKAARNYADEMEFDQPDMAPVASMLRKFADRCERKGIDA